MCWPTGSDSASCRDVLADGIGFGEPEGYVKDWTINGEPVTLGVVKQ